MMYSFWLWYTSWFQQDTDLDERETKGVKMGILTVLGDDDASASLPTDNSIAIVLEESIVLADLPDFPTAFAYLFGLVYALNMEFPKDQKYIFETIQHILMEFLTACQEHEN